MVHGALLPNLSSIHLCGKGWPSSINCSKTDRLNTPSLPSEEEEKEEGEGERERSSSSRLARICLLLRTGRGEDDLGRISSCSCRLLISLNN